MYNKAAEIWSKICHSAAKPVIEITELNAKSLSKLSEQVRTLHDSVQTRRPEDFISANLNALTAATTMITEYNRKAAEIIVAGLTETGKLWSDMLQDSACQVSAGMPGSGKSGNGEHNSRQK